MSNPISYFFSLSEYENSFRTSWLRAALPYAEYVRVKDLHLTFLRELYPAIYAYGPNGNHVEQVIIALTEHFHTFGKASATRTDVGVMARDLDELFGEGFPLPQEVMQALHRDNRLMEIYLYSPHAHEDSVNRNMHALLEALQPIIDDSGSLPIEIRQNLSHNVESFLSVLAAADLLTTSVGHPLLNAATRFLTRWDLPLARTIPTHPSETTQEVLSYIPDY